MKQIYYLLLLFLLSANYASSQCEPQFSVTAGYSGLYSFTAYNIDTNAVYNWGIQKDGISIYQDTATYNSVYQFTTNGSYQLCLTLNDTVAMCLVDTCVTLKVTEIYQPMLDSVNIWNLTINPCIIKPSEEDNNSRSACNNNWWQGDLNYTQGDTIINNLHYLRVFLADNNQSISPCILGFIREDSINRKVYFNHIDSSGEELLYDFDLQPGDLFRMNYHFFSAIGFGGGSSLYDTGYYRLDSIGKVKILAGERRAFYFNRNTNSQQLLPLQWIEGVGSLIEPVYSYGFNQHGCFYAYDWYCSAPGYSSHRSSTFFLTCYSHTNKVYFDSCAFAVAVNQTFGCFELNDSCNYRIVCGGINELPSLSSFTISPNPATAEVNIRFDVRQANKFSIIIHDINGRQVSSTINLGRLTEGLSNKTINVSGSSSGIYIVECRTSEGSLYRKLVVD